MKNQLPDRLFLSRAKSPIGEALIVTDGEERLRVLDFDDCEPRMHRLLRLHYGAPSIVSGSMPGRISKAIDGYFAGELDAFGQRELATAGTAFQREVWRALRTIEPA